LKKVRVHQTWRTVNQHKIWTGEETPLREVR